MVGVDHGLRAMRRWLAVVIAKAALSVPVAIFLSFAVLPVDASAFQLDEDRTPSSAGLDLSRLGSIPQSVADWARGVIWSIGHTKTIPLRGQCEYGAAPGCGYAAWHWFGSRPDAVYEGEYRAGLPNGHGIYSWSDGARYQGEFREGKFQGHGIFIWANGDRYEGEWNNGEPNGEGRLATARQVYAGSWSQGCFRQGPAWTAIGKEASSCPFAAKPREYLQNDIVIRESPEQGQFSALFACVQAGRRPDAICISDSSRSR